jgi:hypothetical protein
LSVIVPPTGLSVELDLTAGVQWDFRVPFTNTDANGAVECAGILEQLVVRSWSTRHYHFYYRIQKTIGGGAIKRISSSDFGNASPIHGSMAPPTNVAFRKDLPGSSSVTRAARSPAGNLVWFTFYHPVSCANGNSAFMLVKTSSDDPLRR